MIQIFQNSLPSDQLTELGRKQSCMGTWPETTAINFYQALQKIWRSDDPTPMCIEVDGGMLEGEMLPEMLNEQEALEFLGELLADFAYHREAL